MFLLKDLAEAAFKLCYLKIFITYSLCDKTHKLFLLLQRNKKLIALFITGYKKHRVRGRCITINLKDYKSEDILLFVMIFEVKNKCIIS